MINKESFCKLINNFETKIGVIGLGQVGLPTALTFAKNGFSVMGYDVNDQVVSSINSGKLLFQEDGLDDVLEDSIKNKKFHATPNFDEMIKTSDVLVICVPTPLTKDIKPDLSIIKKVCSSLSTHDLSEKLIIVESSIPPGTFEKIILPEFTKNHKLGQDFWAVFVPERLSPGQALSEMISTPRIIGYVDQDSGIIAKNLYEKFVQSEILITPVMVAEVSKLVENTFRDVNVALANEVAIICEKYGIDVQELISVCNSHPRVNLHSPGPGVGGPCLPKDPILLLNPPEEAEQINSSIILQSRKINDSMPFHVIEILKEALEKQGKSIHNASILVLGVAYKGNVSDTRLSPAKKIIEELLKLGCPVNVYDPKTNVNFGGQTLNNIWDKEKIDAILILADHNEFKELKLEEIRNHMKDIPILIDTKRIFDSNESEKLGIQYLSVGYKK